MKYSVWENLDSLQTVNMSPTGSMTSMNSMNKISPIVFGYAEKGGGFLGAIIKFCRSTFLGKEKIR